MMHQHALASVCLICMYIYIYMSVDDDYIDHSLIILVPMDVYDFCLGNCQRRDCPKMISFSRKKLFFLAPGLGERRTPAGKRGGSHRHPLQQEFWRLLADLLITETHEPLVRWLAKSTKSQVLRETDLHHSLCREANHK